MKGSYREIGRRIREARVERGWSQGRLGEELGVTQTAINYYENARRRIDVDSLMRVAEALGRPMEYFTGEAPRDPATAVRSVLRERLSDVLNLSVVPLVSATWNGRSPAVEKDVEEWLAIPRPLARGASCAARVRDAAMASRGIAANDIVFVRTQAAPGPGSVVLVRLAGGLALREYAVDGGTPVLRAPDAGDPGIPPGPGAGVIGVVVGLYRQL
jgi:repressor LexA